MNKTAAVHESQHPSNERKAAIDRSASFVMGLSIGRVRETASEIAKAIRSSRVTPVTLVICGGAGSGKTTLSNELSKELEEPVRNLDDYIRGGFTKDVDKYYERLTQAIYDAWEDLPHAGWILEHVEACNPRVLEILRPNFALHLDPGHDHLSRAAKARDMVSGEDSSGRLERAKHSKDRSEQHFESLQGRVLAKGRTWTLKALTG